MHVIPLCLPSDVFPINCFSLQNSVLCALIGLLQAYPEEFEDTEETDGPCLSLMPRLVQLMGEFKSKVCPVGLHSLGFIYSNLIYIACSYHINNVLFSVIGDLSTRFKND